MGYDHLLVHSEGPVGWLEYNRPPVNAFNWEMTRAVGTALEALEADPAVRVVVLASALERHFSVGAELSLFDGIGQAWMREWVAVAHGVATRLRALRKPVLGAIHGTAVGGGLEMTYHADVRFCAEDARLGQPEVNLCFIPPIATTQTLVRLLGRPRALRFLYEGELIPAGEAHRLGLVDELVEPGRLRERVQAYGEALAAKPPEALAAIRRTITEGMELPFEQGMALEAEAAAGLADTANFADGVRAFLQKRPPAWK